MSTVGKLAEEVGVGWTSVCEYLREFADEGWFSVEWCEPKVQSETVVCLKWLRGLRWYPPEEETCDEDCEEAEAIRPPRERAGPRKTNARPALEFGQIKAIETSYQGYRFRSRLEARWAVYFDTIGLEWEYEPQGFDLGGGLYYLPDFWLPQVRMWAEVKPEALSAKECEKAVELAAQSGHAVLMLVGTPAPKSYWGIEVSERHVVDVDDPDWYDTIDWIPYFPVKGTVGLDDPTKIGIVEITDYIIATSYLHEHRFYANTGEEPGKEDDLSECEQIAKAVAAARSARFEHGESPR